VALRLLYWILRSLSWKVILEKYDPKISLFHLFMIRMYGHAVSQLTPTAQLGSEATRIFMTHSFSKKVNITSVIVDKTLNSWR